MASSGIDIKITGDDGVERVFTNLPKAMARKAYIQSLKAGAKIVRKAAIANVREITSGSEESTGLLSRSLAIYSLKKIRGQFRVAVQVRRGTVNARKIINGEPVRVGLYASVLEYGKAGQPPRSWIRKAARENAGNALNIIAVEVGSRLEIAIQDAKK